MMIAEARDRARGVVDLIIRTSPPEKNFDRRGAEAAISIAIYELHQARPDLTDKGIHE
jgi:hypothetical protein